MPAFSASTSRDMPFAARRFLGAKASRPQLEIAFARKNPANRFAAIIHTSQPHAMEQPVGALGTVDQRLPAERVLRDF
jgi:hypothetical protein